jgi:hypothetical protein
MSELSIVDPQFLLKPEDGPATELVQLARTESAVRRFPVQVALTRVGPPEPVAIARVPEVEDFACEWWPPE